MHNAARQWLLAACDPQTAPAPSTRPLAAGELAAVLAAAKQHAVLGATLRSAAAWGVGRDAAAAHVLRRSEGDHLRDVGRTLGLRHVAHQATAALARAGLPCCLLKGEDFAARLYPTPALRPYRDVDLLTPRETFADADRVIQSLGFVPLMPRRKYAAEQYGQISYHAQGPEQWSLELHWNLINSPAQRQQCSLTWDDLDLEPATPGSVQRLSPASLLVLASVHACLGHRFDSLQQLCDLRQICRGVAGAVEPERLMHCCRRLRCETPLAWSLDLLVRVFRCEEARRLRAACQFSNAVVRPLRVLGRETVLEPHSAASRLRRSWARLRLKNAA